MVACGRGPVQVLGDTPTSSSAPATTTDPVASRSPLPPCGEYHSQSRPPEADASDGCLLDAFQSGRPAELIVHRTTIEGDPVDHYYRVREKERVEVIFDGRQDKYGGRLQHDQCWSLTVGPGGPEATRCKAIVVEEPAPEPNAAERAAGERNEQLIARLPSLEPAERGESRMTTWPGAIGPNTVTRVTYRLPAGADRCALVTKFEDAMADDAWTVSAMETPDLSGTGNIRWAELRHGRDRVVLSIVPTGDTFHLYAEADSATPAAGGTFRMPCGIGPK